MPAHHNAGKNVSAELLIDVDALRAAYFSIQPDVENVRQRVSFGTSGHRGTALAGSFNEAHILAISQSISEYRVSHGINGPLFVGKDTHALSHQAEETAIEVFLGNGVATVIQADDTGESGFTPTPVISHTILCFNKNRDSGLADGVVITPSHNPPADGGFKYNPPHGGPADSDVTAWIEARANEILRGNLKDVKRVSRGKGSSLGLLTEVNFAEAYIAQLGTILDMEKIRESGLRIGVDPLGGAGVHYWAPIATKWGLDISVVNKKVDPTFRFMKLDHDGKVRMDCSSPYAMAGLVQLKDKYDIAFGNDPDADRHGIVAPSCGLLNPNHYLAVAIRYLFSHRTEWKKSLKIGKTLVSSGIIDRVAESLSCQVAEVPVGFKWFVQGLYDGTYGFGGEESAGASFLRKDGSVWSTDKDGILLCLLAAEITAVTGRDPGEHFSEIAAQFGQPFYARIDCALAPEKKAKFKDLEPNKILQTDLAGESVISKMTHAPANGASIGGIKISTANGWFAARPSGTEDIYKIYAESFKGPDHLERLLEEAAVIVDSVLA